ncbi:class A rhodopsin-like G-protein coupled receptor GPRnna10, putative [Pediculus humanus corporis]|uniref:Class A rhodopsin-like G-protein coupled receptor GPRnna10, putative n=1 Tax=Pediculus humanus subsp. corporis TaxID=121224 RepID=E0VL20_PEDHC|nr:class A rhodopsin-like G-protein coupled receptor GPRnna10, putative [Pediculus humanus corporis]EEB14076.1 class A rhodopsin-like G-protein coupled receptor GPRnna10, putative [Pediculus humanus corporis]
MTVLYSVIAVRLWNSELNYSTNYKKNRRKEPITDSRNSISSNNTTSYSFDRKNINYSMRRQTTTGERINHSPHYHQVYQYNPGRNVKKNSHYRSSKNILKARRRVIRMLTMVVLAFAICNLPFHARKMWQYWSTQYDGTSSFSSLFTPITFLCTYCNSLINPLLYAFLSKNFQKSIRELFTCTWSKSKYHSKQISFRQKSHRSVTRSISNNG